MLETNFQLFVLDRIANNCLLVLYFNIKNLKYLSSFQKAIWDLIGHFICEYIVFGLLLAYFLLFNPWLVFWTQNVFPIFLKQKNSEVSC